MRCRPSQYNFCEGPNPWTLAGSTPNELGDGVLRKLHVVLHSRPRQVSLLTGRHAHIAPPIKTFWLHNATWPKQKLNEKKTKIKMARKVPRKLWKPVTMIMSRYYRYTLPWEGDAFSLIATQILSLCETLYLGLGWLRISPVQIWCI